MAISFIASIVILWQFLSVLPAFQVISSFCLVVGTCLFCPVQLSKLEDKQRNFREERIVNSTELMGER